MQFGSIDIPLDRADPLCNKITDSVRLSDLDSERERGRVYIDKRHAEREKDVM